LPFERRRNDFRGLWDTGVDQNQPVNTYTDFRQLFVSQLHRLDICKIQWNRYTRAGAFECSHVLDYGLQSASRSRSHQKLRLLFGESETDSSPNSAGGASYEVVLVPHVLQARENAVWIIIPQDSITK